MRRCSVCRLAGGAASFRYLNRSDVYTLTDVDDAEEFRFVEEVCLGLPARGCGMSSCRGCCL